VQGDVEGFVSVEWKAVVFQALTFTHVSLARNQSSADFTRVNRGHLNGNSTLMT